MLDYMLWWSIYIRCKSKRKLIVDHLPTVTEAIGPLEFQWEIGVEDEAPGLFRIVTHQNFFNLPKSAVFEQTLSRAGRFRSDWHIMGLHTIAGADPLYLHGSCTITKPSPHPPSLESLVFELEQGKIEGMTDDGGWKVAGGSQRRIAWDEL